ncbi:MAG: sugar transferase [Planctomycetota bacterium]
MLHEHARTLSALNIVCDAALITGACVVASHSPELALPEPQPLALGVLSSILFIAIGSRHHLYQSKRTDTLLAELFDVMSVLTTAMGSATILLATLVEREHTFSAMFLSRSWVLALMVIPGFRFIMRSFLRLIRRKGYNFRTVLLVGNNVRTERILKSMVDNEHFGLRLRGILDADGAITRASPLPQVPHLGSLDRLREILTDPKHPIDEVICTLPLRSHYAQTEQVVRQCEEIGIPVKIASDLFDANVAKTAISWFGGDVPLVTYFSGPSSSLRLVIKRMIDLLIAAVLLLLASPILLVTALAVKLTSHGPVFFRQKRVGFHGKEFTLFKFRSMVVGAEEQLAELRAHNEMSGPVFKMKQDPRVTSVGKFIRRWSIDELPQLINVLKGDMSLVGPRPPVPAEVAEYEWWQRRRLSMKPGLTCIWQVSGRNQIGFERWMELDLHYIDNWSLWLDTTLLLRTIPAVLSKTGM